MDITEAESQIMQVLWEKNPQTAEDIMTQLQSSQEWQEGTVKALINRLLNKGAISAEKEGRRYWYSPVLQRDAWISRESKSMLARLFSGRLAPLVAHFAEHDRLSKKELDEIKKIIAELERHDR